MKRPTILLDPPPPPPPAVRLEERTVSVRALAAAVAPGLLLALALWAGHAPAQTNVCRGGPSTGSGNIDCVQASGADDIVIAPGNAGIDHSGNNESSILARHGGTGGIEFRMTAGTVVGRGTAGHGMYARHNGATGGGAIVIHMSGGSIETRGSSAYAIWGRRESGTGNVGIDVTGGSLSRTGATGGVVLGHHQGTGSLTVNMSGGSIEATGAGVRGLTGSHRGNGNLTIGLTGGSIATPSIGIGATRGIAATAGNIAVTVAGANSTVKTTGHQGTGVNAQNSGSGNTTIAMRGGLVETTGNGSIGLNAYSSYTGTSPGTTSIVLEGGTVRTRGGTHTFFGLNFYSHGVYAESNNGRGDVSVRMTGGAVETAGASANGIRVIKTGPAGAGSIEMTGGSIAAAGDGAYGAYVWMGTATSTEGLSVDAAGEISVEGLNARGLAGFHLGLGSAAITTGAAAEVAAPFAIGMEGRLTNDDSASGRILVTHGGAAEARDVGILAWARRSSGHTMGSTPPSPTDDAARTTPMIHVTSSGDVTVGASVADAFIRGRIAGADETLSAAEQAVLDAITAEDSSALTTALAALPADDYDAAWKAEAQNLLRKRSAAPTGDGPLAHAAAEEILGLSRAGVRAMALSHTAIADHVRAGDALSAAERAVLTAVLTKGAGTDLETALTALPDAAYDADWKNTVRQHALTYNAGDIQVDVTGGSISAEGNGVEAFYAVPHDSNGDVAVTVSAGARVTGGAKGIWVRGAGVTAGARNQTVTVNGAAMGGTGAGVHLVGGGAVTVGASGEVGATSGVGVLGDGGGDVAATVSGTVTGDVRVNGGGDLAATVKDGGTVTGDLRVGGSGSLTATVEAGGVVEGTIRDPQASFTVGSGASIGRVLYASGGTVTVSGGGTLTGVEGVAAESTTGLLTVTVDDEGRVEGDLKSGGTLMATVNDGGVVTGTIHDPQASFTVAGSVGRVLYASGGTVTVSGGGTLTGVEGVAAESTTGLLTVTVDDEGRVEGDLKSGGTLMATVNDGGVVTGTIHNPQASFTVAGSVGRVLYASGGAVTVSGGGTLTGVEGVAAESTTGLLTVTVDDEGRVEGDLKSGGTLMATVNDGGVVTGTIHNPQASFTVAGSVGRVLYASGGAVTVSGGGTLTGVEGVAAESTTGLLTVTVDDEGRVEGDLKSGGTLMATVNDGGVVTGTIHDPQASFTVAGSVGRVLYASGGAVTVAGTGRLTGVEVEGRTEALRSEAGDLDLTVAGTVTGDVRALGDGDLDATISGTLTGDVIEEGAGDLSATVSGTVDGDLRAEGGGALTLNLRQGGTVTGTVHDPASPLTVAGTIGRLLYTSGATVTVAATGALTGVEVEGKTEALRSEAGDLDLSVAGSVTGDVHALGDGDLDATISGTLTGDVFGLGAGEHTVTVANGGTVTGTVHLAASTVRVDGRAGRVRFDKGGTVTVGKTGSLTGIEVGGRTEAIRNAAGELVVSVAGRVTGDIIDLGARPARVTTEPGSTVAGSVDVAGAGSEVRVGGTVAEQVRFRRGGMVTVGPDGKVEGRVSSDEGELVAVVERKPEETEDEAFERAFPAGDPVEEGGTPTLLTQKEGEPPRPLGMVSEEADAPVYEARMRVYEALPSVVLGLNGVPGFRERMAAPRSAQGGWARVEALRGKWKAEASTSGKESGVGLEHRHRRHGVAVGWAGALGEEALVGVSLHHRRGSAEVSEGGDLELSGTGAGVSGTWVREEVYVDVQAAMTGYEADLTSSRRGVLKKDVSGHGHALGVEAGRRLALEYLPAGVVLTPRAGLVHSRVSVDAFSDAMGSRVTVDGARSLKGRVGVEAEVKLGGSPGSRVFGSVEVEHEFSTGRKVRVSGRELRSEADATWLRLGLDGAHTWEDGRYTLQGGMSYATSGGSYEFGGGLSLNLRF